MFLSRQLAATGSAVEAAALLAAIGECEQAVVLLLQHNSCREACLLAQHSDAVSPAVRRDAWLAMAAVLQTEIAHLREQVFMTLCPRDVKHDLLQHVALAHCPV